MAQWIMGYGSYATNVEFPLTAPGPIRRIIAGFYINNASTVPVALEVRTANDDDNDVMLFTNHSVKIQLAAGLVNAIIWLLVEFELEYPSKQAPPP
jgi:hypothetical protein